jgi:Holliday junction resolvase
MERDIVKKIKDYIKANGGFVVKFHGGPYAEVGIPDLLCCIGGVFVAVEVKQPGKKPTAIQEAKMAEIRAAGGRSFAVTSLAEFLAETLDLWTTPPSRE